MLFLSQRCEICPSVQRKRSSQREKTMQKTAGLRMCLINSHRELLSECCHCQWYQTRKRSLVR